MRGTEILNSAYPYAKGIIIVLSLTVLSLVTAVGKEGKGNPLPHHPIGSSPP